MSTKAQLVVMSRNANSASILAALIAVFNCCSSGQEQVQHLGRVFAYSSPPPSNSMSKFVVQNLSIETRKLEAEIRTDWRLKRNSNKGFRQAKEKNSPRSTSLFSSLPLLSIQCVQLGWHPIITDTSHKLWVRLVNTVYPLIIIAIIILGYIIQWAMCFRRLVSACSSA